MALKVPTHEYAATVGFYRDTIQLTTLKSTSGGVGFEFGTMRLWVDEVPSMTRAELWFEVVTDDLVAAAKHLSDNNVVRCDAVESLPDHIKGFWILSPSSTVHLVALP